MALSSPTQVYYNLDIANEQLSEIGVPPNKLSFTEVRSSNLLDNPNDYFMSIVRFSLDTAGALPIFIPQIDTQQSKNGLNYPNKTIYNITLQYYDASVPASVTAGPLTATLPVYYIPHRSVLGELQNQRLRPPSSDFPLTLAQVTSEYFWVQSWGSWISMLNACLAQVYNELLTLMTAASIPTPTDYDIDNPPFFRWNDETAKASFVCPADLFNQGGTPGTGFSSVVQPYNFPDSYDAKNTAFYNSSPPNLLTNAPVTLFFNAPLHILFSSFEWVFNSYSSAIGEAFMMRVYSKMGDNWTPADTVAGKPAPKQSWPALTMEQEYGTGAIMCPVARIVFLASLIPVLPSNVGLPRLFSNNTALQQTNNNNMANEVTDLIVNLVRGDEYLPNVIYEPTAEYRLLDLQSNTPASSIQLGVQWQDIYGYYHDFYLQNGCGANLKIMFRKKAFNNISS